MIGAYPLILSDTGWPQKLSHY